MGGFVLAEKPNSSLQSISASIGGISVKRLHGSKPAKRGFTAREMLPFCTANHDIMRSAEKLSPAKVCAQWEGRIMRLPGNPLAIPGHRSIALTQRILSIVAKRGALPINRCALCHSFVCH
jgi:hypothetical protein